MNFERILVVDIEATCWENENPPGQRNEIIEIGIAALYANGAVTSHPEFLVKPVTSTVSAYCTQLTTLTQEQVDEGMLFSEAVQYLMGMGSKNVIWASYGDYDRKIFTAQCEREGVEYPFSDEHLNIKSLFAFKQQLKQAIGMARALKMLKLPLEGTHHRGKDDAFNTAKLLGHIL